MTNTLQLIGEPKSGPHFKVCKVPPKGLLTPKFSLTPMNDQDRISPFINYLISGI